MRKMFRRKRTWLIIILLVILAPVVYGFVMMNQFTWSDKEVVEFFKDKKVKTEFNFYAAGGRNIFYASAGSDTLPMVLFIHGAPGSWTDYIKYFGDEDLVSRVHLVAVDRPGYGKSGLGNYITSIDDQANMIMPALSMNKSGKPAIILGHSYGGPVAARIAQLYADSVGSLILIAPAIDPDNEKQFAINRLGNWKIVQSSMPKMWLSAWHEKKTHVDELRKMDSAWSKIRAPVIYMFGDKDQIVPPVNAQYAKQKMANGKMEVIEFPSENHFLVWTQQDTITKTILKMIQE